MHEVGDGHIDVQKEVLFRKVEERGDVGERMGMLVGPVELVQSALADGRAARKAGRAHLRLVAEERRGPRRVRAQGVQEAHR